MSRAAAVRYARAYGRVIQQRAWMHEHGVCLSGYRARYGAEQGAEIFAADNARLELLVAEAHKAAATLRDVRARAW